MEERKIEIHEFYVSPIKDDKRKENLSNINGKDLFEITQKHFAQYVDNLPSDISQKRVTRMAKEGNPPETIIVYEKGNRIISGKILTGLYGKEEDVVDSSSATKDTVYTITKTQAIQKPFFFMIIIPNKMNKGFLLLERDGVMGIKIAFTRIYRRFFNSYFVDYKMIFGKFIDIGIVERFLKFGEYNNITLTRNILPADVADRYELGKFETDDFGIELKIKPKGNKKFLGNTRKKVLRMLEEGTSGFFTYEGFEDIGFGKGANIKVESKYNNSTRVIDLSDTMRFKPYYVVAVSLDSKGHSDFRSIKKKAIELIEGFKLELNY